jgi:hypothetical protein
LLSLISSFLSWEKRSTAHPDLLDGDRLTHTANGLPGDPLNIAIVGSEEDVIRSLLAPAGARPMRSAFVAAFAS